MLVPPVFVLVFAASNFQGTCWDVGSLEEGIEINVDNGQVGTSSLMPASSLQWPGICSPLLERRNGEDYPWAIHCRGFSYFSSPHDGALLCSLDSQWHRSTVCELFRVATNCVNLPCTREVVTPETLSAAIRRGQAPLPRGAGELMEVLLAEAGAVSGLLEMVPSSQLTFQMFLAIYTVAVLCLREKLPAGTHQQLFKLRANSQGREGCRDLVSEHFEHVFAMLASTGGTSTAAAAAAAAAAATGGQKKIGDMKPSHAVLKKTGAAARRHIIALLPQGPLGVADVETSATHHYDYLPTDEPWSRFVVRTPRETPAHGLATDVALWRERQEGWGWQSAWAAVRLANRLEEMLADPAELDGWLDAWIDSLGAERQSMLDGREWISGEQRQIGYRRWRGTQQILTPISGHYRPMWRAALLQRVAEATEKGGPHVPIFQSPDESTEEARRTWNCGAVLSWADIPVSCSLALHLDIGESDDKNGKPARAPSNSSLINLASGGCRVVLNRAILRTPMDAAALGQLSSCNEWYGMSVVQHNVSYAVRPQWLHADLVAVDVLEHRLLPAALQRVAIASQEVHNSSSRSPLRVRLHDAAEAIAEFTYYMFNGALYTRGSAAIAILSHHAMYLSLLRSPEDGERGRLARHRLQALRCLPNWRAHTMPDVEATSSHTAQAYTSYVYWKSFDSASGDPREELLSCLERALVLDAESEERGRQDAHRLQKALRELKSSRPGVGTH